MKAFFKFLPIVICFLLMAAHWSRADMNILAVITLILSLILFWKSHISGRIVQVVLFLFGLEWIRALISYTRQRIEDGEDWVRLAIILGVVALFNFASILVFRSRYMRERYNLE